jgi:alpha-galactosidase
MVRRKVRMVADGHVGDRPHLLSERLQANRPDNAIDVYRQDLNIDPLPFWKGHDAPDRVGITEIRHVTGYLAFWDELQRRHPDLLIDSCASGGRRNDLESLRRAVPLWRSDYVYEPIGTQGMTYGLSAWLPYTVPMRRMIELPGQPRVVVLAVRRERIRADSGSPICGALS